MRPKQFLDEALDELRVMFISGIILFDEYRFRKGCVLMRYIQKTKLRKSYRRHNVNSMEKIPPKNFVEKNCRKKLSNFFVEKDCPVFSLFEKGEI